MENDIANDDDDDDGDADGLPGVAGMMLSELNNETFQLIQFTQPKLFVVVAILR